SLPPPKGLVPHPHPRPVRRRKPERRTPLPVLPAPLTAPLHHRCPLHTHPALSPAAAPPSHPHPVLRTRPAPRDRRRGPRARAPSRVRPRDNR
ncbi:hypothetical protein FA95DRAFT_1524764, partial [Auriscalpium vulgare]